MSNRDMKHWDELEGAIRETVAGINDENALVISVIETLNRLADLGNETLVPANEHGEMHIVVGGQWRITRDEDSGQWYTTDRIS